MAEDAPHLLTEVTDGILVATLNRPDKLNALSGQAMALLDQALLEFRSDPLLRVMLIRAEGRYFSSGADLRSGTPSTQQRTASGIRENHRTGLHGMHRIYDEMEHIEKPIVCAIHAPCVGGGLELALSCDFRLASPEAEFSFPEGLFGVLPASNGVSRLTRICGPHWARWMIMAGRKVDANRALAIGLVHDILAEEDFHAAALDFCRDLTKNSAEQMGAAKVAIDIAAEVSRDTGRHVERMANASLMLNPEYLAVIEKYIDKLGSAKS